MGAKGAIGPAGLAGAPGFTGFQGVQGFTGIPGSQGIITHSLVIYWTSAKFRRQAFYFMLSYRSCRDKM